MARYKRITVIAPKMAEDPPEIEVQARQVPIASDYSSDAEWWNEIGEIAKWARGVVLSIASDCEEDCVSITLESGVDALQGDWIFEKKGSFQLVYDDAAFRKNYEFMGYY